MIPQNPTDSIISQLDNLDKSGGNKEQNHNSKNFSK